MGTNQQFEGRSGVDVVFANLSITDQQEILSEVRGYEVPLGEIIVEDDYRSIIGWDERREIVPLILRKVNLTDGELDLLLQEDDAPFDLLPSRETQMSWAEDGISIIRFVFPSPSYLKKGSEFSDAIAITDLAAASAIMAEMSLSLANASRVYYDRGFEEDYGTIRFDPPRVQVRSGSIEFAVGGGLFSSGLGLVVACSAGIVASPVIGPAVGLTLATVGAINLAYTWRKQDAEAQEKYAIARKINREQQFMTKEKALAETQKLQAEARIAELDARQKELEIESKEIELQKLKYENQETFASRFAHSQLVERQKVKDIAENSGYSEAFANHVLNRSLPTLLATKQHTPNMEIEVESEFSPDENHFVVDRSEW